MAGSSSQDLVARNAMILGAFPLNKVLSILLKEPTGSFQISLNSDTDPHNLPH